jgi:hypothetical protein
MEFIGWKRLLDGGWSGFDDGVVNLIPNEDIV